MTSEENRQAYLAKVFQIFSKMVQDSGPYITASYTLLGAILGLGLAGYLLDGWLNTEPWLLLTGITLGLVVGFYEMGKIVLKK